MWAYELLDDTASTEKSVHLSVNVLLGLIFGFTLTIGYFDYVWIILPQLSSFMTHFASKIAEPLIVL